MGTTPSAAVVFGIPYSYKAVNRSVTRYDEITGAPYSKTVSEHVKMLDVTEGTGLTMPELGVLHDEFVDNYSHGQESGAIGIKLAEIDCWGDTHEVLPASFERAKSDFEDMVHKFFRGEGDLLIAAGRLLLTNTTG